MDASENHRTYTFFLSYARAGRSATGEVADFWVAKFFGDLSRKIAELLGVADDEVVGFIDQNVRHGTDWRSASDRALHACEVLVPLYSPDYFSRTLPASEHESFLRRLSGSNAVDPHCHVVPVLWTPFPSWQTRPESDDALRLGDDRTPDYPHHGARALCMQEAFAAQYRRIVDRAAIRVTDCARRDPLAPQIVTDSPTPATPAMADAQFIVAMVESAAQPIRPIAEQIAQIIDRLGPSTAVVDLGVGGEPLPKRPCLVLIDPRIVQRPENRELLSIATGRLTRWAVPVLLIEEAGSDAQAVVEATRLLSAAGLLGVGAAGRSGELMEMVPHLLRQARSRYLKYGFTPPAATAPPAQRYSLRDIPMPTHTNRKWTDE
jgi:hypothetical protein